MTSKKGLHKEKGQLLREEYTLPRKEYTLSLDDDKTLQQKGDVEFIMELKPNTDPQKLRSKLELIAEDKIGYANYIPIGYLVCVTEQATYENLTGINLEKVAKRKQSRRNGYTRHGYREVAPAKVPEAIKDEVVRIQLNYVHCVFG